MTDQNHENFFKPFKGENYTNGFAGRGKKLLLLGESSFLPKGENPSDYRNGRKSVANYIRDDICAHWMTRIESQSSFVGRLQCLLTNKTEPSVAEVQQAWSQVAFTNYIPIFAGKGIYSDTSAGEGAPAEKNKEHWQAGRAYIENVINNVQPDRVLVLGKMVWNDIRLGDWHSKEWAAADRVRGLLELPVDGHAPALATWVYHPSRGRDSWERMRAVLDKLLAYPS